MTKDEICLLIKVALDADNEIDINASADNIPEWDSLGHLSILTALDQAVDGRASSLSELSDATSVTGIINILESKKII